MSWAGQLSSTHACLTLLSCCGQPARLLTASLSQYSHLYGYSCCGRVGSTLVCALPPILLKLSTCARSQLLASPGLVGRYLLLALPSLAVVNHATSVILLILSDLEAFARHDTWLCMPTTVYHCTMSPGGRSSCRSCCRFCCLLAHAKQSTFQALGPATHWRFHSALCLGCTGSREIISPVSHCLLVTCTALFDRLPSR